MAEQALAAIPSPIKGKPTTGLLATLNLGELVIPLAILSIIVALITPMPALLLDFLLAIDIMLSVVMLMVSVYIPKPVEFTVFPTTLLMLTLVPAGAETHPSSATKGSCRRFKLVGHSISAMSEESAAGK